MIRLSSTLVMTSLVVLTGCMTWTPGWEEPPRPLSLSSADVTIAEAHRIFDEAGNRVELGRAIDAYGSLLASSPDDIHLHTRLAEAHILYGAAYATSRGEKRAHYERGLRHAERAMATNAPFKKAVESGESIAEASERLGEDEMEAMLLWVTGVSYYFKESLGLAGKVLSFRTIAQTGAVLERLMDLDPEFENGAVPFSLAIHYIARPPWAGRDLARARELMDQAISISPESLLVRWGRAKYLHSRTGDLDAMRQDLEWVISQDPRGAATSYRWNVYFQRDARAMLAELESDAPSF